MPTEYMTAEEMRNSLVKQAIRTAEDLLPGIVAPEGECDPRWQTIIKVGEYIETNPQEVWHFVLKWGKHPNEDLRSAIATCLLEHLLEYYFDDYFPLVKATAMKSKRFAFTFQRCAQFGKANKGKNAKAFKALQKKLSI